MTYKGWSLDGTRGYSVERCQAGWRTTRYNGDGSIHEFRVFQHKGQAILYGKDWIVYNLPIESYPIYRVFRQGEGTDTGDKTIATTQAHPDRQKLPLYHRKMHSPDGFNYGYAGSGPADLARSILAHYLKLGKKRNAAPGLYQDFKRNFIENCDPVLPLIIYANDIAAWLREWKEKNDGRDMYDPPESYRPLHPRSRSPIVLTPR